MRRKMMRTAASVSAVILAAAILGTALTGCGSGASGSASSTAASSTASSSTADYEEAAADYMTDEIADYGYSSDSAESNLSKDADMAAETAVESGSDASDTSQQKLIVTWDLSMETEKYDDAITQIRSSVEKAGGYIESENESSYYETDRFASLTLRIPEANADSWIAGASDYGTIVNRSKNTEDITLTYVDTQSRLTALRSEQTALLNMMEKAESITDLITIQSQLTEVNSQIESYESQLRVMDNQVNYTTIYMNISEVNREIVQPQTFGEEVHEKFISSMESLAYFLRYLAVGILGNSVIIILVAAFFAAVILIVKKIDKRRSAKSSRNKKPENTTEK